MKITIVGGGTAGWMTASYLVSKFKDYEITLIESKEIPIIGVGESTLPSFLDFINEIGITEEDLFKIGSIRKYATEHNDWNFKGHQWWHYLVFNFNEEEEQTNLLTKNLTTDKKWRYTYHIDANKFAILCRDKVGIPNNVNHVYDTILDCKFNSDGITELVGEHGNYTSDLYIDCSGFQQLLIGKFNNEINKNNNLINNKAWAGHAAYNNNAPVNYTRTHAMNNGWQWNICLQDRVGVGYVFSDKFVSDEDAKKELLAACPYAINIDTLKLIKFESKWMSNPWQKNVLAIGLSAGFLEPLESQSIFLVQMQIQMLDKIIKKNNKEKLYNKFWNLMVNHIAEYLAIHYTYSSRTDTSYWNSFKKQSAIDFKNTFSPLFHDYSYKVINRAYFTNE